MKGEIQPDCRQTAGRGGQQSHGQPPLRIGQSADTTSHSTGTVCVKVARNENAPTSPGNSGFSPCRCSEERARCDSACAITTPSAPRLQLQEGALVLPVRSPACWE